MKKIKNALFTLILTAAVGLSVVAQSKIDEQRMERDIAVAENVLSTLMRQQFAKSNFFPMDVQGTYMPGFGVTFRLPEDFANQLMFMNLDAVNIVGYPKAYGGGQIYIDQSTEAPVDNDNCEDCPASTRNISGTRRGVRTAAIAPLAKKKSNDSLRNTYSQAMLQAAKDFMADYGDMISQLSPDERIVVTNKSEGGRNQWLYKGADFNSPKKYMSMEATKSDIALFKQGKLTRDQFFGKLRIINAESADDLSPDLELLGSIFNRLYRADLSKTYFLQEEIYYERLKDYGVIYNMHAYSSTVVAEDYMPNGKIRTLYEMPTLQLSGIDKDERLKKVKELYPAFEKNVIDDVLEYSKTLKSLKDNEVVIFNVKLTECKGCNIPTSLEITIKESVLKDYSAGRITKDAALAKATIKKGPNQ